MIFLYGDFMKIGKLAIILSLVLVAVLSGCSSTTEKTQPQANTEKKEVELVPARKTEEKSSRTVVVERDGKFYEMLEEHERLCSDCDR